MKRDYAEFRKAVKDDLRSSLAAWELSEDALEEYVSQEEEQIKGAYDGYLNPRENDTREEDVRFRTDVSTIAYCLQMCY